MKRQLLFLVVASGLALMAAPNANAGAPAKAPGFCGNSYAMLMTGYEPNLNPATGSGIVAGPGGFPGALTAIVGIGVIQFSSDCSAISGELIYNDGDLQFLETGVGVVGGPTACYSGEKFLVSVPCFDGGNHFTGGSVTTAGEPPGLTLLQFTANFNFFDYGLGGGAGSMPFAFNIQETTGDTTLVGNTVPSPTAPVLTLTMQQQSPTPVPTTFGKAPYVGNSAIICSGQGANDDDLVAFISNNTSGGVAGSYGTAVGSVNIGLNGQASGILSFNGNDNLQVAGATAPPPNNTACAFSEQLDPFDGPAAFADGTSNIFVSLTSPSTDPTCTNAANTDAGFTTSEVAWGSGNLNSYAEVTSLNDVPDAFVPPGEMSTCTHLFDGPKANGNQNNQGHQ
ncbi:hypothetical protein [Candidatus Binatus sp.]|uniref:hypothetical protein n=1 Tax=Candidatus Binatus sp. TaxID=2811406 RepID=UPI003BB2121D